MTCAGTRAAELALRLKYAGVDDRAAARRRRAAEALDAALGRAATGRSTSLPTYTALLELRDLLAQRGQAEEYWR